MTKGAKIYFELEKQLREECDQMVENGECDQDWADFRFSMVRDEILEDMDDKLFEIEEGEKY